MNTALQTFTENSLEDILDRGGDYDWVLDPARAKKCMYLVCCSSQGANRKSSFLIGKVNGVEYTYTGDSGKKRYLVTISEYASIDIADSWPNKRQNPVRYASLEELGIDLGSLNFKKVLKRTSESFTIAQAKTGLARHYGVSENSVEITIKG